MTVENARDKYNPTNDAHVRYTISRISDYMEYTTPHNIEKDGRFGKAWCDKFGAVDDFTPAEINAIVDHFVKLGFVVSASGDSGHWYFTISFF